jgi:hemerythrin
MNDSFPRQLLTGIDSIDDQHRALIRWAHALKSMETTETGRSVVIKTAQFLIAYARYHFDAEEYAMVASGYQEIAKHRREHSMMRRQLNEISEAIKGKQESANGSMMSLQRLIQNWLQNHISSTDLAFARFCEDEPSARDVHLPSPRELRKSGSSVSDYDQVEAVHGSGELTIGQVKARLKIR